MCLLLALLALGVLALGLGRDCLDLANEGVTSGPTQVCTTTVAPGAVVFDLICLGTALVVWLAQRRG